MYPQHSYRPANRPPGNWHKPPNFIVQLRSRSNHRRISRSELNALIEKLPFAPRNSFVFIKGFIFGSLLYDQWSETLEVIVELWRIRLEGGHLFTPWVKRNVEVLSDKDELKERIKLVVFLEKLKGLLLVEGELLQKWENKLDLVCDEITKLDKLLKSKNNLRVYNVIMKNKEGFEKERDLIRKRIKEFREGIECIIQHLQEKGFEEEEEGLRVFKIRREYDWDKIRCLMMRECRRHDDCLPVFAFLQ